MTEHESGSQPDVVVVPATVRRTAGGGAEITPGPLSVELKAPPVRILLRHHAWSTWAEIAIDHEALAREARATKPVDEFKPGLISITAAAFSLDAFYSAVERIVPTVPGDATRGAHVAERLKRGVSPGRLAADWPRRIKALFVARDDAVHFGEQSSEPVWHPALNSNVSVETWEWRLEAATNAVDLLLEVYGGWAHNPSRAAGKWAKDFHHAVEALIERRRRVAKSNPW